MARSLYVAILIGVASLAIGCSENSFSTAESSSQSKTSFLDEVDTPAEQQRMESEYDCERWRNRCNYEEDDDHEETLLGASLHEEKKSKKVLICHLPGGDQEKGHNICISVNAVKAHIDAEAEADARHGRDYYGPCKDEDGDD